MDTSGYTYEFYYKGILHYLVKIYKPRRPVKYEQKMGFDIKKRHFFDI